MTSKDRPWQVSQELALKYTSPLDRRLFCDIPAIRLLGNIVGKSVLDMGCGNGGFTRQLASARSIVGVDTSDEMLEQARQLLPSLPNLLFQKADVKHLPFPDQSFDRAVASMLINTLDNREAVEAVFHEASRVLTAGGRFVVAMPNPLTLDKATKFRWTEWKEGQTQQSLEPGEEIIRKFMGKDGAILTVPNYYWPPDLLMQLANQYGLTHAETFEPKATAEEIQSYPELDSTLATTPFFLLMAFDKK